MTAEQKAELWAAIKAIPSNQRRTDIFTFGHMQYFADRLYNTVFISAKPTHSDKWAIFRIFEYDNHNASK